jgi:hypothetical protein
MYNREPNYLPIHIKAWLVRRIPIVVIIGEHRFSNQIIRGTMRMYAGMPFVSVALRLALSVR